MSRRRRPNGPVSVHVFRAGQREAERAKFLGVNHLRRLGAFAGPVEEVDAPTRSARRTAPRQSDR